MINRSPNFVVVFVPIIIDPLSRDNLPKGHLSKKDRIILVEGVSILEGDYCIVLFTASNVSLGLIFLYHFTWPRCLAAIQAYIVGEIWRDQKDIFAVKLAA